MILLCCTLLSSTIMLKLWVQGINAHRIRKKSVRLLHYTVVVYPEVKTIFYFRDLKIDGVVCLVGQVGLDLIGL